MCSFNGCEGRIRTKGLCDAHYAQLRMGIKLKPINRQPKTLSQALNKYIKEDRHGLLWIGNINKNGYGRLSFKDRLYYAHRVSYELKYGPIDEGLELDHDVDCPKNCVTPGHLTPRTKKDHAKIGWERGQCDGGWSPQSNFARRQIK